MISDALKNEILEALKPIDPQKVILFGSYAWGDPDGDSDIDLYIVTKDEFVPQDFEEKMKVKLKVANAVNRIREKFPVDLIVHTVPMYIQFKEIGSSFSRDIFSKGIVLL